MEKMMKPAEYAKELGISRQAVYAKIKRGILTAKNVDGKLYIVIDKQESEPLKNSNKQESDKKKVVSSKTATTSSTDYKDYKALLDAKDETISVLKGTVKDLKKSNKQISTTLRGEIDLLKDAFHEMRTLYAHQLEHKKAQEVIEVIEEESVDFIDEKWVSIKKFFKQFGVKKEKHQEKIEKRLKKAHKSGDDRFMKEDGKLKLDINKSYEDIVK
jgi:predicted DNA-binding protein YlxM (UPF0122 family)